MGHKEEEESGQTKDCYSVYAEHPDVMHRPSYRLLQATLVSLSRPRHFIGWK